MEYSIDIQDKKTLITVNLEKFDAQVSPKVKQELVALKEKDVQNIIFDLSAVKFCDSSGLSSLLIANRICKKTGGVFILCGLQPYVKKVITISQLDTVIKIVPTLADAIDFLFINDMNKDS